MSRRLRLLPARQVQNLPREHRAWVAALELHLLGRFQQNTYDPLDDGGEIFLTDGYVKGLLEAVGAPRVGEKAAAEAIAWWQRVGLLEDTGKTKRPKASPQRAAAREHFGSGTRTEGGRDAQPSTQRSYWWRVFRVVPIARVIEAYREMQGAYARLRGVPQLPASLSALLRRQGLIPRRRSPHEFSQGSVQWVFANSGPP
jgi:hypothetical protein